MAHSPLEEILSEAVNVQMPQLDHEMEDGVVVQWLKAAGDPVERGDVLAEIETDKAIVEVDAPASGVLRSIDVPAGEVVPVGTTLAVIEVDAAETAHPSDAETPSPTASVAGDQYEIPLSPMRRAIASRTSRSMREAPHFYVISEIDMTRATEFRREFNKELPQGVRVSVNDLIVKASALAIDKYPTFNSYFKDNRLISSPHVNIGIAVALDEGLVIPAILDCQDRDLVNISKASRDLIQRAHGGALKPREYAGGTFAISNMGMYDVESFTAIIYPPNAAVLAIGSVKEKPVVKNHEIVVGRMMKATLSIDHRVVDGAGGARFLHELKRLLEHPDSLKA